MTWSLRPARAAAGALLSCLPMLLLLAGCAHHRASEVGCRQPQFSGNTQTLPPMRAPSGLNAPDTTGGVRIPALNQPAPTRARNAPCLEWPPTYVSEPPVPPTRRPST